MKKFKNFAALLLCTAIFTVMLTGCPNVADILGGSKSYSITITQGITNGLVTPNKARVQVNETVVLTASPANGYELSSITAFFGNTAITLNGTGNSRTFTMPSGNVTVNASFTAIPPTVYNITIASNIANGSVSANKTGATAGETITLTATPSSGYQFTAWNVKNADNEAITVSEGGTFTMPESAVTVSAVFTELPPETYSISVTGGIATVNGNVVTSATAGTSITITANSPDTGKQFSIWTTTTSGVSFGNANTSSTTFFMPESNVSVTANYTNVNYTISQASSFSNGNVLFSASTATYNSTVTLTIEPSSGYKLDNISVTKASGGTVSLSGSGNGNGATRTFSMPASNVTVSATFTPETYAIVRGSTSNGLISVNSSATYGSLVTVTATPDTGYQLGSITVTNGSNNIQVSGSGNNRSFYMPAGNVTINATFTAINYNISITNGTAKNASGQTITTATIGTAVTIIANAPTGQQDFNQWTTTTSGVNFASATASTTTFSMPARDVIISSSYQNYYTVTYASGVSNNTISVPTDTTHYHTGETVTVNFEIGTRPDYDFIGWNNGSTTYTSSGTASFTIASSNVTLTAQWGAPAPTEGASATKAVGDIVLNDGSIVRYANRNQMNNTQKNRAIAIIFDAVGQKGVGLTIDSKQWCSEGAALYNNNTLATSTTNGQENSNALHPHMGVWDAPSYPAFWWAEHYSAGNYTSGWYLPATGELLTLFSNEESVSASLTALGITSPYNGDPGDSSSWFWSSTTLSNETAANFLSDAENPNGAGGNKAYTLKVCAIHVF